MRRCTAAILAGVVGALTGCAAAPPGVAAVGFDGDGYFGVVMLCDRGRSFTQVAFEAVDGDAASVEWVGRTVEPITFFRLTQDPPDNWIEQVPGGLVSDTDYRFVASAADLRIEGPQFTLADLNTLGADQVVDTDGTTQSTDDFLDGGCTG